ncbi:MAG: class I tRNA ligase family protein [Vicingaceae bacterium]
MNYEHRSIEKKWQKNWEEKNTFRTEILPEKKKYYVLDMFPYPSGAGLHVGHPLGYIASDILARYKRLTGFNVLHPMGFDSFGLPAEQYAIQTGQHPAKTTEKNIDRYREQLKSLGFSYDWEREVQTSDPSYYRWTQWIFLQLFDSWYDKKANAARHIDELISFFEKEGNTTIQASHSCQLSFDAEQWKSFDEKTRSDVLLDYRLTYLAETVVNWCPELGTVLANDEVKEGLSERGGYPVVQKKMRQWMMRITAYADRLLDGLEKLDWSDSVKDMQRNWIGRSEGASVFFEIEKRKDLIEVFTTRPDTLFGVSFMVLAPEHPLVGSLVTSEHKESVLNYVEQASRKSERDRISEVKKVSGVFTGSYALHPLNKEKLPIYISDYVLLGYGTGAIMAVPSGDQRDWNFARAFDLPIPNVIEGADISEGADESKGGRLINSDFLNGMPVEKAIKAMLGHLEEKNIGLRKIQYRLRDAVFSRQRYWGEPIPIYFNDGIPMAMDESELPLELPEVDKYLPTKEGDPPLARAEGWHTPEGFPIEANTMPGWAGSSWYLFRYMDPTNTIEPFSQKNVNYWRNVDFYVGGAEHATGHLLYSRFWTKFLYDTGKLPEDEPFKKMLNQGMIQGKSAIIHRYNIGYIDREDGQIKTRETNLYLSNHFARNLQDGKYGPKDLERLIDEKYGKGYAREHHLISPNIEIAPATRIHVDVNLVDGEELDVIAFKQWQPRFKDAIFLFEEDEKFIILCEVEKMSKTKFNVINPDELIERYGADSLRCYEMFLGPVEQHKPWDQKGIEGVSRFLKRFWALFHEGTDFMVLDDKAPLEAKKAFHKFLKKVSDDIERLSFNTVVSEFMILTNALVAMKCRSREILEPFVIAISPYAPHIAEELWEKLGHKSSVTFAKFPLHDDSYLKEDNVKYPISFNGKVRFTLEVESGTAGDLLQKMVLEHEDSQRWLEGKNPKKVIIVPNKIVNIVV